MEQPDIAWLAQALSNINTDGNEELVNFINYYNLLINVNLNNRNIFRLDSNELIILNQIAATNSSAAQSAKGILTFVYGNYYDDANIERIIDSENFGNTTKVTPVEISKVASVETQNVLITYPNPANNTITIKYTIVNKGHNNSISINDITGKTVFFRKVLQVQANSTIDFDTKEWANGTYVVILTNSKYGSVTSKIVIAH